MLDRFSAASDKDIYDLLMSGGSKLGHKALLGIARSRGIVYSEKSSREQLASVISLLPHDYNSVKHMIDLREQIARQDKRAYASLATPMTKEEVKAMFEGYEVATGGNEKVRTLTQTELKTRISVGYEEVDYSKTRLIQRQHRDAEIEILTDEDQTTFRMPAGVKPREIVEMMCAEIRKIKLADIPKSEVSLAGLSAERRNRFFMTVMGGIEGYSLQTVISMKVASFESTEANVEIDEGQSAVIEDDLVFKINSAALNGQNLLATPEYQNLKDRGFFLTAITWRSLQERKPHDLMQFDASFDDPIDGTGFKFGVRIAKDVQRALFATDFKPLDPNRQPAVWALVEQAATKALVQVRDESSDAPGLDGAEGE